MEVGTPTVCRACLGQYKLKEVISIFENHTTFVISDELIAIGGVNVSSDDGLPNYICYVCLHELEEAFNFKTKCKTADFQLRNAVQADEKPNEDFEIDVKTEQLILDVKYLEDADDKNFSDVEENVEYDDIYEQKPKRKRRKKTVETTTIEELLQMNVTPEGEFQCDVCKSFFKSKCKLKVHFKKEHVPKKFTCNICKKMFKSVLTFRRHAEQNDCEKFTLKDVRIEGEGKDRMYYCHKCQYKSDRMVHMRNHVVVHTKEKPFRCKQCGASYTQRGNLYHHMYMKHSTSKTIFPCDRCGKYLYSKPHLRRHLKTHGDASFECSVCSKKFKTREGLRVHSIRHKGEKNYACENCGSCFFTHAELCNHKKYHLMLKKYQCDLCPYATQRKDTLTSHRKKHSPDNPFPCIICGRVFPTIQKLEFHATMHSKEKEVNCPFCEKKFLQKRSLKKHCAKKHGQTTYDVKKNSLIKEEDDNDTLIRQPLILDNI